MTKFEEIEELWDVYCQWGTKHDLRTLQDMRSARVKLNALDVVWDINSITIKNCIVLVGPA